MNEEQIIEQAKKNMEQWLEALRLDGKHDTDRCLSAMQGRKGPTGEDVLAIVAPSPEESTAALIVGALACCDIPLPQRRPTKILKKFAAEVSPEQWRRYRAQVLTQMENPTSLPKDWEERVDEARGVLNNAYRCIWDYYWMAFYESAMQASGLSHYLTDQTLLPAFQAGIGFVINLGSLMVGVQLPEATLDERQLLHNETGPAVVWNGDKQYWWHGTRVQEQWIEDKDAVDPKLALTWENVEERRALCEILGWERVLSTLSPTTVDTDPDPEIGTLIRVDLPDAPGSQFLKVRCGTGRTFVLPVPENMETALEANAWTFGISPEDLQMLEVRT